MQNERVASKSTLKSNPAWNIVGGLSSPAKMPCYSYSIPSDFCQTGSKLRNNSDSVCNSCYTFKGKYRIGNVQNSLLNRFNSLRDERWVDAMVTLLKLQPYKHFRWHDSGDLQGPWHLEKIIKVAEACPDIKFWLPTQEYNIVEGILESFTLLPDNLNIRLSSQKINITSSHPFLSTSLVVTKDNFSKDIEGILCRSYELGGKCGNCRQCWDKKIKRIIYMIH